MAKNHKTMPMLELDEETTAKLRRMGELKCVIRVQGDSTEEHVWEEFRRLQSEMVEYFLPVVAMMARAGLFTATVQDDDGRYNPPVLASGIGFASFDVEDAYENGNITVFGIGSSAHGPTKIRDETR